MMRPTLRPVLFCMALAWAAPGQEVQPGATVADFTVLDAAGHEARWADLRGPVTVITFLSTRCPVSNAYDERMNAVYRDYSGRGVKFIFVNANSNEPVSEVAEHAKSAGFDFPVYKDPKSELAYRLDAQVTPESFVIDRAGTVVYHGQIDDSRNPARVEQKSLRMSLDAVLAGKPVPVTQTKAFGCSIKRARRTT